MKVYKKQSSSDFMRNTIINNYYDDCIENVIVFVDNYILVDKFIYKDKTETQGYYELCCSLDDFDDWTSYGGDETNFKSYDNVPTQLCEMFIVDEDGDCVDVISDYLVDYAEEFILTALQ